METLAPFRIAAPPVALETLTPWARLDAYDGIDLLVHLHDKQGNDWLRQWVGEQWSEQTYTRRDLYYRITPSDLVHLTCNRLALRTAIRSAAQSFVCDTTSLVIDRQITRQTQTMFYRFVEASFPKNCLPQEGVLLYFDPAENGVEVDAAIDPC